MPKDLENTMVDNNLYILTEINPETTTNAVIQLTQWVEKMPFVKKGDMFYNTKKITTGKDTSVRIINAKEATDKIYSPYEEIPEHIPVLNVYINSSGGSSSLMKSILSMFYIASFKGTIIRTYNIGRANSCASMIAVSGTHGYRYMAEDAKNVVHYGYSKNGIQHPNELEFVLKDFKKEINSTRKIYLNNSKLTKEDLEKYYNIEGSGNLSALECLFKGLCDWVITDDGRFVNVSDFDATNLRTRTR